MVAVQLQDVAWRFVIPAHHPVNALHIGLARFLRHQSGGAVAQHTRGPHFGHSIAERGHAAADEAVEVRLRCRGFRFPVARFLNGLGQLLINAIQSNDLPLVQTLTFIFAVLIVTFNLIADVLYGILDPRIRYD